MSAPGPWSVGPAHVVAQRIKTDDVRTTRFVAEAILSAPYVEGEREANARLIAAAPDLLESAKHALQFLLPLKSNDEAWSAISHLTAAIAKATQP